MSNNIDAVIAALRIAQKEAEKSTSWDWKVKAANRWINQLPGAWMGRWRHLKLRAEYAEGRISRNDFIGHVKAVLAYLETNREAIASMHVWSWPFSRSEAKPPAEPVDAEFNEVTDPEPKRLDSASKPVRLVKR